jgi:GMP synthase (glutamine-hydrolysing)
MARHETVLILDFGSQYTQLIARRVREQKVYCEILPFNAPLAEIAAREPSALILSGGPASVTADDAPRLTEGLLGLGVPVLGICYGLQAMTQALGGQVARSANREYGRAFIRPENTTDLLNDLGEERVQVWMSHGDHVSTPAPGFQVVARSEDGVVAAVAHPEKRLYGVQFHPEVVHTPRGDRMLRNFLFGIAGLRGDWTPASFVDEAIARIRAWRAARDHSAVATALEAHGAHDESAQWRAVLLAVSA